MQRDLPELAASVHDLLVIGGGIHGACAAWDASLRGLSVALVEREDFGGATSANSLKIVHGGLRHLQRADWRGMREGIRERAALLRIAPHLVHPLAFLVPTGGPGCPGRLALGAAVKIADLVGADRNRGLGEASLIPASRVLSRQACLTLAPLAASLEATGGVLWHDGQLVDSERLTLAFLLAAAARGARVANYAAAVGLLVAGGEVRGARVRDALTGDEHEVRARATLNAAGPWAQRLLGRPAPPLALGINLVCSGRLTEVGLGLRVPARRTDRAAIRGRRYVFLAPWRSSTLIGTSYHLAAAGADDLAPGAEAIEELLADVRSACPALALPAARITAVHRGLVPLRRGPGGVLALTDRSAVVDHADEGLAGLVTVGGAKYTTARAAAERAIDAVLARLGRTRVRCRTSHEPLPGARAPADAASRATVVQAVREEMALTLCDLVLRRTPLGAEACPTEAQLAAAAGLMAAELGWSAGRRQEEIASVRRRYAPLPLG